MKKNYVTLEEVCVKGSSNIAQKDLENNEGRYPIYGASGFIKNVDFYAQDKSYIAVVKDGAGIGRTMMLPAYSSVIGTMQYLLPKDNIDIGYLYYAVTAMNLAKYYTGATIPHIYFKDYRKEKMPVVDKIEQKKIVEVLSKIDALVICHKRQLDDFEVLVKSRFMELFGDICKEDYLYPIKKLGDVAKVGSSHRVFTTEFVEKGIPFYRGTEIGELSEGKKPSNMFYISREHYDRLACDGSKPLIGDLLLPSICNKGQVWLVDTNEPFYYKDGRVLSISPDRSVFNPKYLEYFMRMKTKFEYIKLGSGSTFAEFKIFILKNIDIEIPPLVLQNQFADFVERTNKSKFTHCYELLLLIIKKIWYNNYV